MGLASYGLARGFSVASVGVWMSQLGSLLCIARPCFFR